MANWISALGKEDLRVKRIILEDMADQGSVSLSAIDQFCLCEVMCKALDPAVKKSEKGQAVPHADLRRITVAGRLPHAHQCTETGGNC